MRKAAPGPRRQIAGPSHVTDICGCAAPFSQMLIAWGNVAACCYQDRLPIGDLRNERLRDIWNGPGFRRLRRKMLAGGDLGSVDSTWPLERDLSRSACHYCATFDEGDAWRPNRTRSEGVYNRYFTRENPPTEEIVPRLPCYIEFKYSMLCNLECPMCVDWWRPMPVRWKSQGIPYDRVKDLYDANYWSDLRPFLRVAETICFLGGEPLIQPEVWKTLSLVLEENPECEVRIVSNLSRWHRRIERRLETHRNLSIAVSIESSDPELYGFFRSPASLSGLQSALDSLNGWRLERLYGKTGDTRLTAIVTVTALTIETLVPTVHWLKRNGVSSVHFDIAFHPVWRWTDGVSEEAQPPSEDAVLISPVLLPQPRLRRALRQVRRHLEKYGDKEVVDRLGFCRRMFDPVTRIRLESTLARLEALLKRPAQFDRGRGDQDLTQSR